MPRRSLLLLAVAVGGCVTLTPAGARVAVYSAPLDGPPSRREMPAGCQKVAELPERSMSERELEGSEDPLRQQRNAAGGAGGNVLLVLKRMTGARLDVECPNAVPITQCSHTEGAWFAVVFESYACTPEALKTLGAR